MAEPTAKDLDAAYTQADAYLAEVSRHVDAFSERTRASTRRLFVAIYAQARADHRAEMEASLESWAHGATEAGNMSDGYIFGQCGTGACDCCGETECILCGAAWGDWGCTDCGAVACMLCGEPFIPAEGLCDCEADHE